MNHNTALYKRELKRKLQCTRRTKVRLLEAFDHMLKGFLSENPDPTFEELTTAFGPPEEMVQSLQETISDSVRSRYHVQTVSKRIIAAILVLVLVAISLYALFAKEFKKFSFIDEGYASEIFSITEGE